MKNHFSDLSSIVLKSAHLYRAVLKQTFLVVFLFLLFEELVGSMLLSSSWAQSFISPGWANGLSSMVSFFCSVFLVGYLMTAVYAAVHQHSVGEDRAAYLRVALKCFSLLMGVTLAQGVVIFTVVAFYVFLSTVVGLEQAASQGIILGFFLMIAFAAYTFVSQAPAIVLFQKIGIWAALKLSAKIVRTKFVLVSAIMLLNMIILLLPSILFFQLFSEVFGVDSLGIQQVVHIFLSTLLTPIVQLILIHLYVFLFEKADAPYQQL